MELLAGERGERGRQRVRKLLVRCDHAPVTSSDWHDAAALYRACRARGETVRSLTDCLVAAVAIREGLAVLHTDRDFAVLARHTPLELA
jgi:predicted nucleic acid-binding protein